MDEISRRSFLKAAAIGKVGFAVRGITVAERNLKIVFGANTLEELAVPLDTRVIW
jgi:hypothetical protein